MGRCWLTMSPQCNVPWVCPDLLARRDQLMTDICRSLIGLIPNAFNFHKKTQVNVWAVKKN